MGNVNKVFLMGNLTRNIEVRSTGSGQQVANLGLAINRYFTDASGEKREDTTFVDCEAWGKTGETMAKYLTKGRPVFIEGRLKLDQWEDKEGKKQSRLRVVVESFQFVDSGAGRGGGEGSGEAGGGGGRSYSSGRPSGGRPASAPAADAPQAENDDIPF